MIPAFTPTAVAWGCGWRGIHFRTAVMADVRPVEGGPSLVPIAILVVLLSILRPRDDIYRKQIEPSSRLSWGGSQKVCSWWQHQVHILAWYHSGRHFVDILATSSRCHLLISFNSRSDFSSSGQLPALMMAVFFGTSNTGHDHSLALK